ncbi:MAG: NAD(P)/FAD-dependent oxidoreductase [Thermodesulfobacteriota bacterium]
MSSPVIVIGGGIGGLSSAVRLAQRGEKVYLFEKEPRVGGYAISFRRKATAFDLALHVVPCGGAGQQFAAMVEDLGLDGVEFIRLAQGFEARFGDFSFTMANDYDALFASLESRFPQEVAGLRSFRKDLESHAPVYEALFDHTVSRWRAVPPFLPKIPSFLKRSSLSSRDYLQRYFDDERLIAVLFQPALFMGIPMDEFPTVNFLMMFYLLVKKGMYTIRGGGQALTDRLTSRFIELGGSLQTRQLVTRILVKDGRAEGVMTEDGKRWSAKGVLSAINLPDTVHRLVGRANFPKSYLENLDGLQPSISVIALNVGLATNPKELGIKNHIAIHFPDADIDSWIKKQRSSSRMDGFSVTAHTNSDPEFSEGGLYPVSIVGGTDPSAWMGMAEDEYRLAKSDLCESLISRLDGLYPGFRDSVAVTDLATPRSMHRYTANPMGAIMGLNCSCGLHRQILKACDLPIRDLAMAGAWTGRLGGFMQSMKSGILAAEAI